jgi:hypothetical protein
MSMWTKYNWHTIGANTFCSYGEEPSVPYNSKTFLDGLNKYQLLKERFVPSSYFRIILTWGCCWVPTSVKHTAAFWLGCTAVSWWWCEHCKSFPSMGHTSKLAAPSFIVQRMHKLSCFMTGHLYENCSSSTYKLERSFWNTTIKR